MEIIIQAIAGGMAIALTVLLSFFVLAPRKWKHDNVGYGYPEERNGGDSFQSTYSCEFCHGDVTQDSQGNWFHLTTK